MNLYTIKLVTLHVEKDWRFTMIIISLIVLLSFIASVNSGERYNETSIDWRYRSCRISQEGWDGFGHQLEGKLSCIIASFIDPRVAYVHHPFNNFEHSDLLPNKSESFLSIFNSYPLRSELLSQKDIKLYNTRLTDAAPDFWLSMVNNNSVHVCNNSAIYSFDNCWIYIYHPKIVKKLYDKTILDPIRTLYHANSKPQPFFDSNRFNIVIHIRRCDAGKRILDKSFYISAIRYFNSSYKTLLDKNSNKTKSLPMFWIESDDPKWPFIKQLKRDHPDQVNVNEKVNELLLAFHRMVSCDGFVMSLSSLSFAAMLLNGNAKKIVAPHFMSYSQDRLRDYWLNSDPRIIKK